MKRLFYTLVTLAILTSCSCPKQLVRLQKRCPLPEKRDTVWIQGETIYRDTVIYRYLPGESKTVEVRIPVVRDLPDTSIILQTTYATALAHLKKNKLGLELIQHDTVFQFLLEKAIKEQKDTIVVTNEKIVTVEKEIPPKPFWKIGFLIMAGLIVIGMFLRFALGR